MAAALAALADDRVAAGLLGLHRVLHRTQTTITLRPACLPPFMIGIGIPRPATNDEGAPSMMISTDAVRLSGDAARRSTPNGCR